MGRLKEFYDGNYWLVKQPVDQTLHAAIGFLVFLPAAIAVPDIPIWSGFLTSLLSDVRMEYDQYPWHKWFDGPLDLFFYGLGGMLCAWIL